MHPDGRLKSRRVKECRLDKMAQDRIQCVLYSMGVHGKGPQLSSRAGLRAARAIITIISGTTQRSIYWYLQMLPRDAWHNLTAACRPRAIVWRKCFLNVRVSWKVGPSWPTGQYQLLEGTDTWSNEITVTYFDWAGPSDHYSRAATDEIEVRRTIYTQQQYGIQPCT